MAGATGLEPATSCVSTDGTASHWKYIIGNVIVYRDVYRELSAARGWRVIFRLSVSVQDRCQVRRSLSQADSSGTNRDELVHRQVWSCKTSGPSGREGLIKASSQRRRSIFLLARQAHDPGLRRYPFSRALTEP